MFNSNEMSKEDTDGLVLTNLSENVDSITLQDNCGSSRISSLDSDISQQNECDNGSRHLTPVKGASLIVGVIIGSGIFSSPGSVAGELNAISWALLSWIVSGILSLMGALVYAELGSSFTSSGGEFVYLKLAYGDWVAFLFPWAQFLVMRTASLAIISIVFAQYIAGPMFGLEPHEVSVDDDWRIRLLAALAVICLTFLNLYSAKDSIIVQTVLMVVKLLACGMIIIAGVVWVSVPSYGGWGRISSRWVDGETSSPSHFGVAMILGLWAYDGWNTLNLVTGDVINPSRNMPRIIAGGMILVIVVYFFVNLSYFALLDFETVVMSDAIAIDVGKVVAGNAGSIIMSILVACSAIGALNGLMITGARVLAVVAGDGLLPHFLAIKVAGTPPRIALLVQASWSLLLVSVGNFELLTKFFSVIIWLFYSGVAAAVIVLRRKYPLHPRPFRTPGYPVSPIVFIVVALTLSVNSCFDAPIPSIAALLMVLSGIPVHFAFKRWGGRCFIGTTALASIPLQDDDRYEKETQCVDSDSIIADETIPPTRVEQ